MHMSLVCYNCFMDPITLIFLLLLALLSLIYMLRSKLMSVLALLIKISFPVCAAIMLSALFIPQLFSTIADSALKANGTYQSIIEADKSLDSIINLPSNIFNSLGNLFGDNSPTDQSTKSFLEQGVYPGLVDLIAGIIRVAALAVSIIGMIATIYISYSFEGAFVTSSLKKKVADLENKIKVLENQRQDRRSSSPL